MSSDYVLWHDGGLNVKSPESETDTLTVISKLSFFGLRVVLWPAGMQSIASTGT